MSNVNHNLISNEISKSLDIDPFSELEKMRNELKESMRKVENVEDPDDILYRNIQRAEKMLDDLEIKLSTVEPKYTARLFEVASTLINAVTGATTSIAGSRKDDEEMVYKLRLLEIKNKELEIKRIIANQGLPKGNTNNTLIVAGREDILNLIENQRGIDNDYVND